jgi:hypothetical protein
MVLTKENFCVEAKKLLPEGNRIQPGQENYILFLHFLREELHGLPFENELGETILMRHDAKEVVDRLVRYLIHQSGRLRKGKKWDADLKPITPIYEYHFYEVFKNLIHANTGLEGICYSLDLAIDGKGMPAHFTLDRYFARSRKKVVEVYRRGCIDLFYDGRMKVFTYQDKWN